MVEVSLEAPLLSKNTPEGNSSRLCPFSASLGRNVALVSFSVLLLLLLLDEFL